jgi:mannose-6-phosphate isomerase
MKTGYDPLKIVNKPWGKEEVLDITSKYCLKKITIFKKCATSLQYHNEKQETSVIHSGKAIVTYQDADGKNNILEVGAGYILRLAPKVVHRIEAIEEVVLYEASTADPGFDVDVVRLEDSYNRQGTNQP